MPRMQSGLSAQKRPLQQKSLSLRPCRRRKMQEESGRAATKEARINFALSKDEVQKMNAWLKQHNETCPNAGSKKQGAIGGRLTYYFTPTTLGVFSSVKCVCGAEELLTDLDQV